jgi:hypothetical protein
MAGRFVIRTYESNDGDLYAIRVQPETVTTANPAAPGQPTEGYVRVTGSKRAMIRKARSITIARSIGTDADFAGAKVYLTLPVFLPATFVALSAGQDYSYKGLTDWKVVSLNEESFR